MLLALSYDRIQKLLENLKEWDRELEAFNLFLTEIRDSLGDVHGGLSNRLTEASNQIQKKENSIAVRRKFIEYLTSKISILLTTAKEKDIKIEEYIFEEQTKFFETNPKLRAADHDLVITSMVCRVNDLPVLKAIFYSGKWLREEGEQLGNGIRHWYYCHGGKEWVRLGLSLSGVLVSAVALLASIYYTGGTLSGAAATKLSASVASTLTAFDKIAMGAKLVSFTVSAVNSSTNMYNSLKSIDEQQNGNYGEAKRLGEENTVADYLRNKNYGDRDKNRLSNFVASGIELTDTVCSVIGIVHDVKVTYKEFSSVDLDRTLAPIRDIQDNPSTIWKGTKEYWKATDKKDFLLGDLNVRDLSRLQAKDYVLQSEKKYSAIQDFSQALNGLINDVDKINEGDMKWEDFAIKRAYMGVEKAVFQQKELLFDVEEKYASYHDTDMVKVQKMFKTPFDMFGIYDELSKDGPGRQVYLPELKIKVEKPVENIYSPELNTRDINSLNSMFKIKDTKELVEIYKELFENKPHMGKGF